MRKSGLALFVILSISVLLPYSASSLASLNDEFSSTSINEGWTWLREPQSWRIQSGWLVVSPTLGTNFWSGVETGNFLYQLVTGNFTIETKVSAMLTSNFQQTGLFIRQDTNNWVKVNFEYSSGLTVNTGTNVAGRASVGRRTMLPTATNLVWLRASRNGNTISSSYSLDGSTWNQHYSGSPLLGETLMVGLGITDSNSRVNFQSSYDYFHYSSNDLVPQLFTIEDEGNTYLTSALSGSTVSDFSYNYQARRVSYNIAVDSGINSACNLSIPLALIEPPFSVLVDGSSAAPIVSSNSTHTHLYFIYSVGNHSTTISEATDDTTPPAIDKIRLKPNSPTSDDETTITASVTDTESGLSVVNLHYSADGGTSWHRASMNNTGGSEYEVTVPKQGNNTVVWYYIEALDYTLNQASTATHFYTVKQISNKTPPTLSNTFHQPNNPTPDDDVLITAYVTAFKYNVKEVTLHYSINGGASWTKVQMSSTGDSGYVAVIPKHKASGMIQYYVEASDTALNQARTTTSSINLAQNTASNPPSDLFSLTMFISAAIAAAIITLMLERSLSRSKTQIS